MPEHETIVVNTLEMPDELNLSTFNQFSNNQISKENVFLKVLGFLGAVIFGFAYAYREFRNDQLLYSDLGLLTGASVILLAGGAWLIVAIAYTYRRDQYVIARIKFNHRLLGQEKVYPNEYNPISIYLLKKSWEPLRFLAEKHFSRLQPKDRVLFRFVALRWMPDVFLIYFCLFPVFIVFISSVYVLAGNTSSVSYAGQDVFIIVLIAAMGACSLLLPAKYSLKLLKRLLVWESLITPPVQETTGRNWPRVEEIIRGNSN